MHILILLVKILYVCILHADYNTNQILIIIRSLILNIRELIVKQIGMLPLLDSR